MPVSSFEGRQIGAVAISPMEMFPPIEMGGANITIELLSPDGTKPGPHVEVSVTFDLQDDMTAKEIQLAALERMLLLLRRICGETPESLHRSWIRTLEQIKREEETGI